MIKIKKTHTVLKKMRKDDDSGYMDASPQERVSFMWDLTAEIWSLKDNQSAKRRLQRNIANLIKK